MFNDTASKQRRLAFMKLHPPQSMTKNQSMAPRNCAEELTQCV